MNPGMIGVFIPIIAVGGFFAWMIARSALGQALGERLKHGPVPRGNRRGSGGVGRKRRAAAPGGAELAERVDFTERLLGQQKAGEQLAKPRP